MKPQKNNYQTNFNDSPLEGFGGYLEFPYEMEDPFSDTSIDYGHVAQKIKSYKTPRNNQRK